MRHDLIVQKTLSDQLLKQITSLFNQLIGFKNLWRQER